MKLLITLIGCGLFSLNAVAAGNSICEDKAKAIVKAVHLTDWPGENVNITIELVGKQKGGTFTYAAMVDSGRKMDMSYIISVDESGPNACYLRSIQVPSN